MTVPPSDVHKRLGAVRLLALDIDGVLTDGSLHYTAEGELTKVFDARDGLGVRLLLDSGVEIAVFSARSSAAARVRLRELGVRWVELGCRDKLAALEARCTALGIGLPEVAYVGDDVVDLPAMRAAGVAIAVADAHRFVTAEAIWVTGAKGGAGAVREVTDAILDARVGLRQAVDRMLERHRSGLVSRVGSLGFRIVVPARYGAARLPGKPLRDVAGKPLVVRVLEQARKCCADEILVATDDVRIADTVKAAGGEVIMTSADCATGTDRLAQVAGMRGWQQDDIVVNLQGDEPLVAPELPGLLAAGLSRHADAGVATVATPILRAAELFDPNVVKVVLDRRGFALYFTRAPVPWIRGRFTMGAPPTELPEGLPFLRHVGLYAYRVGTLRELASAATATLELAESLEQLRALHLGIRIHVTRFEQEAGRGVDTEEDLAAVAAQIRAAEASER